MDTNDDPDQAEIAKHEAAHLVMTWLLYGLPYVRGADIAGEDDIWGHSGGSRPHGRVSPLAEIMIDIAGWLQVITDRGGQDHAANLPWWDQSKLAVTDENGDWADARKWLGFYPGSDKERVELARELTHQTVGLLKVNELTIHDLAARLESTKAMSENDVRSLLARHRKNRLRVTTSLRIARLRAARQAAIDADPSLAPHGSLDTYSNWQCRCHQCKRAWGKYVEELRAR